MSKVSIIIPSRNEKYLDRTVFDIAKKATGDFEIIIGLNGDTEFNIPVDVPNCSILRTREAIDLKVMINKLASFATGKYIYKSDAHCMFGEGFDEILQENMQDDWVVTPRFYVLNAEKWKWQDERFYDYFYLSCPFTDPKGLRFKAGGHWPERTQERLLSHPSVDETPSMHGSGWFVNREYYLNVLKGFPEEDPMGHAQEPIWLGLKNWLIGGKLMVNKNTWYAHMHQDANQRGYGTSQRHTEKTYKWVAQYWLNNSWKDQKHSFQAFVEKFYPMPTWPNNWKEEYAKYLGLHS
jgi:hypothetical protein